MAKITAAEIATRLTDPYQVATLLHRLPNPDPVLRKLGRDQRAYEAIAYDSHVMGELRSIRAGLLGFEWRITPGDNSRKARRAADLVRELMARPPAPDTTWPDVLWTMAYAVFTGYAVHEIVWRRDGQSLLPERILDRPPTRFVFSQEDNSLRLLTRARPVQGEPVPPMRFLVSRHMPSFSNPHGVAVFSSCFWPYTFKHGGFRYLVTLAEKFGLPWVVGKYLTGTNDASADELLGSLQKLVLDATAVVPTDTEISIESGGAGSRGATPQERLIALSNAELSKALTSQTLATEIQGQGSRAASETHRGRERAVNQSDREIVSATLNRLYRWITDLNLGPDIPAPKHEFYEESEARQGWADLFDTARHYLPISQSEVYERLGLMKPKEGEELIRAASPPSAQPAGEEFRAPTAPQFAAPDRDPFEHALEAAIAAAEDPEQVRGISKALAQPLLDAAEKDPDRILSRLAELYPETGAEQLQDLLGRILFTAELWGRLGVDADA